LLPKQEVFDQQHFGSNRSEVKGRPSTKQVDKEQEEVVHGGDYGSRGGTRQAIDHSP
jgi:hypothetical protein